MSAPEEPPRLLHFRISHYNEKVRWALDHKRWPHVRETLAPGLHIPRVRLLTGQNKVPVLVLDGKPIVGSSVILEEVERRRPDPPLFPERPDDRARALEIQRYFDDEVAPELRRLFWATYFPRPADAARMAADGFSAATQATLRVLFPMLRPAFAPNLGMSPAELDRARARLPEHLAHLERLIGPSGYLVGDRFGLADLCACAVMSALLRPPEFPYPLPEPWPPELVALRASIAEHPASRWVARIYREHRAPSAERV